jgi:hypothetical protein
MGSGGGIQEDGYDLANIIFLRLMLVEEVRNEKICDEESV